MNRREFISKSGAALLAIPLAKKDKEYPIFSDEFHRLAEVVDNGLAAHIDDVIADTAKLLHDLRKWKNHREGVPMPQCNHLKKHFELHNKYISSLGCSPYRFYPVRYKDFVRELIHDRT